MQIDVNCDMGEGFGAYSIGDDAAVIRFVSSVNIACGFHAGDPSVMRRTVALAHSNGVAVGAHPGYPDLQGFGRRDMKLDAVSVYDIVLYQLGALSAFVRAEGSALVHVKPHGALYNAAAKDSALAGAIASAVASFDKKLVLVGLAGSRLIDEGIKAGLRTMAEAFADRAYLDDGSLAPRSNPGAVIGDASRVAEQALTLALYGTAITLSGKEIEVRPETICIHGDSPHALACAKAISKVLTDHGIAIKHP